MFSKKKSKKLDISAPTNFQHRVHTGYDDHSNKFVGLPKQWASLVGETPANQSPYRPKAMVVPNDALDSSYVSLFCYYHRLKGENKKGEICPWKI